MILGVNFSQTTIRRSLLIGVTLHQRFPSGVVSANSAITFVRFDAESIRALVSQFPDVFTSKMGLTHLLEYEISLKDTQQVRLPPYCPSTPKVNIIKCQINDKFKKGIVSPSVSPYSRPIWSDGFHVPRSQFILSSRPLTAFETDWNIYEFCRVSFGIASGAQSLRVCWSRCFPILSLS